MNAIETEISKLSETEAKDLLCYALHELETLYDCKDCDQNCDFNFVEPPEITCQRQILKYLSRRVKTLKMLNK